MNTSDVYAANSNWLKSIDLQGKEWTLTIKAVEGVHKFEDGKSQIVISFEGVVKTLGLNKTNCTTIGELFGENDIEQHWPGRQIVVYPTTTMNSGGQSVPCVRIRNYDPARAAQVAAVRATVPAGTPTPLVPQQSVPPSEILDRAGPPIPAVLQPAMTRPAPNPLRGDQFIPPNPTPGVPTTGGPEFGTAVGGPHTSIPEELIPF